MKTPLVVVVLLSLALLGCGKQGVSANESPYSGVLASFVGTDALIQREIRCVDQAPLSLLGLPEFRSCYDSADRIAVEIGACLRSDAVSEQAKLVLCHVAYGIRDMNVYLPLSECVVEGFERGEVTWRVLHGIISPEPTWGWFLGAEYTHPRVIALLERVVASPLSSVGLRNTARYLLSGEALRNWSDNVDCGAKENLASDMIPLRR